MKVNEQAVDDAVLALLFLTTFETEPLSRAWKSFDWDAMKRLHKAGFIGDPVGKSKSVVLTPEGARRSTALFEQLFSEKT